MTDWLSDLREAKIRAVEETKADKSLDPSISEQSEEMLRSAQQRIDELVQVTQVEAQLNQFMDEIIRGHPWFPDSSLTRTVISKQMGQAESKEPQPWSGPLTNTPLPHPLRLENGRYITRIEWNLRLSYRAPQDTSARAISIPIAFSALGAVVNSKSLAVATAASVQAAIKDSFQEALEAAQKPPHSVRRRHRRWYRRLWDRINYKGLAGRALLVLALIVLALLIGWLSINSNRILPGSPRRMVELQQIRVVGYESNFVNG